MKLVGCQSQVTINSCSECTMRKFPHRCNVFREEYRLEKIEAWEWILTPESSNIEMFAFEEGVLRICFKNGSCYDYYNIPNNIFEDMRSAESKGKYLHYHIKGKYRTVRVE